jgi:glyoxylase-like metal-dependent hydrolase (beta-lactamase superfamily II)
MKRRLVPPVLAALALLVAAGAALAQQDFSKVEIKPHKLTDSIAMLEGAGGNIGVCAGADGVFLIDDQFAELSPKILAAVKAISDRPVRIVFNTHFHGDHTGGNVNLAKQGALIVAHDNVRKRMSTEQFTALFNSKTPPSPAEALPVVTFDRTVTFHLNGDDVRALHVANAHTDGDAVLFFEHANVVHMGDCFFNGMYPFIDVSGGGGIDGMIAADEEVLKQVNDATQIIPGHGAMGDKKSLQAFHDMLAGSRAAVRKLIAAKKTRDQAIAAKPTAAWDDTWGKGFIKPELYVGMLYDDLSRKK